jgi:hypothetical protein
MEQQLVKLAAAARQGGCQMRGQLVWLVRLTHQLHASG